MTGSATDWHRSPRLIQLRERLRDEYPRPRRRWSHLVVTTAMISVYDGRPARERIADAAARQTHLLYEDAFVR